MPYTLGCSPAPLTFTIRPKLGWETLPSIGWFVFIGYLALHNGWHGFVPGGRRFDMALYALVSFSAVLSLIRSERVEIYPEQMVWRKTYFGITHSKTAPLADVQCAQWNAGKDQRQGKGPPYIEFFRGSAPPIQACYGLSFEEFDRFRDDIRSMYPDLIKRWGSGTARSRDFTLLNLT